MPTLNPVPRFFGAAGAGLAAGGRPGSASSWRAFASVERSARQFLQIFWSPRLEAPQKAQNQSAPAWAMSSAFSSVTPSRRDLPVAASVSPNANSDSLPVSSRGLLQVGHFLCRARMPLVSHEEQFHVPSMIRVRLAMAAS